MPGLNDLDWIAIAASTFVAAALGAAWYSPALFGEAWMNALGQQAHELGPAGPAMGGSVFSCFVASVSIALLCEWIGIDSLTAGMGLGLVIGLGIVAMAMLSDSLFSGWGWKLYVIQTSYRALYVVLIGMLYGGWPL